MVMRVVSVGPLCCLHVGVPALSLCMRLLRELSCCLYVVLDICQLLTDDLSKLTPFYTLCRKDLGSQLVDRFSLGFNWWTHFLIWT